VSGSPGASSPLRALVIVASTSAASGENEDLTGPVIRDWLSARGFTVDEPWVVSDGDPVARAIRSALEARPAVILTTGGTGVSPSDRTPEAVAPHLDSELPGIIDEIRRRGLESTPMSIVTRGVAGFAGDTFIATLPGSPGGVSDGLAVLDGVLAHLIRQRTQPRNSAARSGARVPHTSED